MEAKGLIDENGGGPGVRLKKRQQNRSGNRASGAAPASRSNHHDQYVGLDVSMRETELHVHDDAGASVECRTAIRRGRSRRRFLKPECACASGSTSRRRVSCSGKAVSPGTECETNPIRLAAVLDPISSS